MTFTQNIGCDTKSSSVEKTTIKIVRGNKNSSPVIEMTGTQAVGSSSQKVLTKNTGKFNIANFINSKISVFTIKPFSLHGMWTFFTRNM